MILLHSVRLRIPKVVIGRMLVNSALDMLAGTVPLLGDLFDAGYKANLRNMALLERHAHPGVPPSRSDYIFVGVALGILLLIAIIPIFILMSLAALLSQIKLVQPSTAPAQARTQHLHPAPAPGTLSVSQSAPDVLPKSFCADRSPSCLARFSLPARCDVGRSRGELCALFRARHARRVVPLRLARRRGRVADIPLPEQTDMVWTGTCPTCNRASSTGIGCMAPMRLTGDTASTPTSSSSIRTRKSSGRR